MQKTIGLFTLIMILMYTAFAANHYLSGYWVKLPTVILLVTLIIVHVTLLSLHVYSETLKKLKSKNNEKQNH